MDVQEKRTLRVGDSAELTKEFTSEDIEGFAELTLDDNGIHTSEEDRKSVV